MSANTLRLVAAIAGALAVVLNGIASGGADPKTIGELVLAIVALGAWIKSEVAQHAAKPADDTHPAPVGEP